MVDHGIRIQRCTAISDGECKTPWTVYNSTTIDGIEFVPLSKRDTGLSRLAEGTPFGMRHSCVCAQYHTI